MYRQWELLADGEAMTAGVTYIKDLKQGIGQLAALMFVFEGATVSGAFAGGGTWRLIDYIDSIEVRLNGNPTGFSMNARLAQAIAAYRLKQLPVSAWRNYATNTQRDHIMVPFGMHLWDNKRYLDLSKYSSVQIRVGNTFTSSLFTGVTCTIVALWIRENQQPTQGFIRREMFREYVPAAGSTEEVILPTEYPLCGVMVQGDPGLDGNGRVNTHPHNLLFPVRFSIRSRNIDVFRDNISRLNLAANLLWGGHPISGGNVYISVDKEVDLGLAAPYQVVAGAGSKTGAAATVIPTLEGDENNPTQHFESAQADVMYPTLVRGNGYHNLFPVFMDQTDGLNEMIDPKTDGAVILDITTRSGVTVTNAFNRVVLERLAPY